jgi:DNA mismatch endonuclease, patch repair protein
VPYYRRDADTPPDAAATERMRAVKREGTKPEMRIRKALHARGMRYRVNVRSLPGRPDIVFPARRVAVLVHGCFWHQHPGCASATTPRVNAVYWRPKLRRNVQRDAENVADLAELGYRTLVIWECEIKRDAPRVVERIVSALSSAGG